MKPIFSPKANTLARLSLVGLALLGLLLGAWLVYRSLSPYPAFAHHTPPQPVQFPHALHVGKVGIACEYCHSSVASSAYAGYPPTHTCMSCHSKVLTDSALLEPVRRSWETGTPIHWNRVNSLPDYVYFNHSVHIANGVGCSTCHGNMNKQLVAQQVRPLTMGWCLGCHRNPAPYLRPQGQIFQPDWAPPADQPAIGAQLMQAYKIDTRGLTDCSTCHH